MVNKVTPAPIRWAGSKKTLLNEMLKTFDHNKSVYVEPFLGSGVVMINAVKSNLYDKYYVNDVNQNLIIFYEKLKDTPDKLIEKIEKICQEYNKLSTLEDKCVYYYKKRGSFNKKQIKEISRSAIFWFLMKAGYNGVYRINSREHFNVPCGKREKLVCDSKHLLDISSLIKNVNFSCEDYQVFLNRINQTEGYDAAFIYCDPPYIPETKSSEAHTLYTKLDFNHEEFVAFMEDTFTDLNASLMISMSDTELARKIYSKEFLNKIDLEEIIRKVNPKKVIKSKEIAFTNY